MEAPVGGQMPAQPMGGMGQQVPQGQQQAKQANAAQFNQLDLPTKLAQLSSGMMLNYDTAISTFATIVQDKSQDLVQFRRALETGLNSANVDANQKRLLGNLLGFLTAISNERTLMQNKSFKGKPLLREAEEEKEEEPKKKGLESDKVEDETSVETSSDDQDSELDQSPATEDKTEEEMTLINSLKGQTIRDSDIELTPSGGQLTLQLVSATAPVEFAWNNTGKVVFSFKGRPYTLRK